MNSLRKVSVLLAILVTFLLTIGFIGVHAALAQTGAGEGPAAPGTVDPLSGALIGAELSAGWELPRVGAAPTGPDGALPQNGGDPSEGDTPFCQVVMSGTNRTTWEISNPDGVSGFNNYSSANFSQKLVSQTPTSIRIEVTAQNSIQTNAAFPVNQGALSSTVKAFLQPTPNQIQSDHPEIIALAHSLVAGVDYQVEAVEAILNWVRAQISYDYSQTLPNDAISVLRNRSGVCAGFSALSAALLRAVGIPTSYHLGCVTPEGWGTGPGGARHAWIEIYFPDAGWVASDPQNSLNFLDTAHIRGSFAQCGAAGTTITKVSSDASQVTEVVRLSTPYTTGVWWGLNSANITGWERPMVSVTPPDPVLVLSLNQPSGYLGLQVESRVCGGGAWEIRSGASWVTPAVINGEGSAQVALAVDARGKGVGEYDLPITAAAQGSGNQAVASSSQEVDASLKVVERLFTAYLPAIER